MNITLSGAEMLLPGGLQCAEVAVAQGKFCTPGDAARRIDLSGYRVLPGIVDLHGDGFEHHLAPRRGVMKDLREGLYATDAELAANGITTAILAQFFSWEGGMRSPEFAEDMLAAIDQAEGLRTDIRVQLRLEVNLIAQYPLALQLIEKHKIPYVVFNDHLPHDALSKGKRPPRLTGQALKSGRSPEAHLALLQSLHAASDKVPEALSEFSEQLSALGVRLGSHDDATAQTRAFYRGISAKISEFPETEEAAKAASGSGDPVILGAPNIVRGGSHKGNVSAAMLAEAGLCDAIASDYHYPSLRIAALKLAAKIGLSKAWALVSARPAQVLGLTDRGHIAEGLRADFIVLDKRDQVVATFCAGQPSWIAGQVAQRFFH